MVKTLLAALIVGGVTFAVVAGCSADTDGTTVKNGSKSKKGDDDDDDTTPKKGTSSGTAGTSSGEPAADCTKLEAADPRPACDTCARSKCCNDYAACENNSDCKALKACTDPLASDDIAGILGCQGAHPAGSELGQTFGSCVGLNCKAECPDNSGTSSGDGGLGGVFGDDDG